MKEIRWPITIFPKPIFNSTLEEVFWPLGLENFDNDIKFRKLEKNNCLFNKKN